MNRLDPVLTKLFGDESIKSHAVRSEQISVLVAGTPSMVASNIINSGLTAYIFWERLEAVVLLGWMGAMWIFAALNLRSWFKNRNRKRSKPVRRATMLRATLWCAAAGTIWGAFALVAFPQQTLTHQLFLVFVIGGQAAGAVISLTSLLPAFFAYFGASMGPLLLSMFFASTNTVPHVMGVMLVLYSAGLIYFGRRSNWNFIKTVTAGVEREWLVSELEHAQNQLEARVTERTVQLTQANEQLVAEVAERKRAEEALIEKEKRITEVHRNLDDAIETSPAALGLYDKDERLFAFNSKFRTLFGANGGGVEAGTPFETLIRGFAENSLFGSSLVERERWIADILATHSKPGEPKQIRLKDGRWLQMSEHRTKTGITASVFTDITQLMEQEEQLRQAQKMEVVGQLTGGIAHDFNNLLGVILGNLDRVREKSESDHEVHESIMRAIAASRRGSMLTQKLLAFSRKQVLQPRTVDLNTLVTGLLDLLQRSLEESVTIKTELAAEPLYVHLDPIQYENALINLAINARDAMAGSGTLTIATSMESIRQPIKTPHGELVPGDYFVLAVRDTGEGIPADVLPNIFEPFFTTKEVGKGSGLGLSMVYGLVKQSGGYIQVDSKTGQGTTVKIYLPRDPAADQSPSIEAEPPPEQSSETTILVVEDDPDLRELAVMVLMELGYATLEAGDGATALDILADNRVDLLFTDVILPMGLNGTDLAQEAMKRDPGLKVLLTSGYTEDNLRPGGLLEEGVQLLNKPYRKSDLSLKLNAILHGAA